MAFNGLKVKGQVDIRDLSLVDTSDLPPLRRLLTQDPQRHLATELAKASVVPVDSGQRDHGAPQGCNRLSSKEKGVSSGRLE
jgi:hypothetical protein